MPTETSCVLGIDGGGTNTRAVLMDTAGQVVGTGRGGPSNYDDVGAEVARDNIAQAVAAAQADATSRGHVVPPAAAVFLGMAGVVSETDRAVIRQIALDLRLAPAERIGVDHDIRIALAGGLSGRPGIVLITGTGSSCYGRNARGDSWQAGGWGHLIADEGSGYWLGVQAMRAAMMAYDGRLPDTPLLAGVQKALELPAMVDIMHRLYVRGVTRAEVAALAGLVLDAARQGDAVANGLVEQGARELAQSVATVARRLGLTDASEVALAGGLTQAGPVYVDPLRDALAAVLPAVRVVLAEQEPVVGAALLARQSLERSCEL
jgi:N-acetylglucosamine kinase-like BadF-type ATPase